MYEIKKLLCSYSWYREISISREEKRKDLKFKNYKIILSDFSELHIKEIWKDENLIKYSYYWFSVNGDLKVGWDNAPHHQGIDSYPHHKHTPEGIETSQERNFRDILKYINKIFNF